MNKWTSEQMNRRIKFVKFEKALKTEKIKLEKKWNKQRIDLKKKEINNWSTFSEELKWQRNRRTDRKKKQRNKQFDQLFRRTEENKFYQKFVTSKRIDKHTKLESRSHTETIRQTDGQTNRTNFENKHTNVRKQRQRENIRLRDKRQRDKQTDTKMDKVGLVVGEEWLRECDRLPKFEKRVSYILGNWTDTQKDK